MYKRLIILLIVTFIAVNVSSQVYDGYTQPARVRLYMSVNKLFKDAYTANSFIGYKIGSKYSITGVAGYNFNKMDVGLWLNLALPKTGVLIRNVYSNNSYDITISGTQKFGKLHIDGTAFNLYSTSGKQIRIQTLLGYDAGPIVVNAGYAFIIKPALIINIRIRIDELSWMQLKYDSGTNSVSTSMFLHL